MYLLVYVHSVYNTIMCWGEFSKIVIFSVMTYMPQDFRGTLIRQQRDRSERNKLAEVEALVNSGGSIHDRYALLWKQQMERWDFMIYIFADAFRLLMTLHCDWLFPFQEETVSSAWFSYRCLQNPCEVFGGGSPGMVLLESSLFLFSNRHFYFFGLAF